jgi:hypothetical protein
MRGRPARRRGGTGVQRRCQQHDGEASTTSSNTTTLTWNWKRQIKGLISIAALSTTRKHIRPRNINIHKVMSNFSDPSCMNNSDR